MTTDHLHASNDPYTGASIPGTLQESLFTPGLTGPVIIFITGPSGAGKTKFCLQLIERARAGGLRVRGVVSPAVFEGGEKTGIDLVLIPSGERRNLAIRRPSAPISEGAVYHPPLITQDWWFDSETLAWANHNLESMEPMDCLVLDELGPLEMERSAGLTVGLKLLDSGTWLQAAIVVRPSLLEAALRRWPQGKVLFFPKAEAG